MCLASTKKAWHNQLTKKYPGTLCLHQLLVKQS